MAEPERARPSREDYRRQLLDGLGGWSGTLVTAIPPVVFVLVNVGFGLGAAILAAVATALALTGYRLLRRQPIQQAMTGLLGVGIAALIAAWTGQARGYFLWGIWTSFAYAAAFLASLAVRRPLVGLAWEFLDPTPNLPASRPWHRCPPLLRAYLLATAAAGAIFLARGMVQLALFRHNATGWLAVARISMGYPLTVAALGFAFLVVRRARRQVAAE
jgi:Protein of unknown function (DUF3159)